MLTHKIQSAASVAYIHMYLVHIAQSMEHRVHVHWHTRQDLEGKKRTTVRSTVGLACFCDFAVRHPIRG